MSEHRIQNDIRNALVDDCFLWRANVGQGWTSSVRPVIAKQAMMVSLKPGDVVLRNARPFSTGLPAGFSDTFGMVERVVTPDMVGQTITQPLFAEIKDDDGRLSDKQSAFLRAMKNAGALVFVWRAVADAVADIRRVKGKS